MADNINGLHDGYEDGIHRALAWQPFINECCAYVHAPADDALSDNGSSNTLDSKSALFCAAGTDATFIIIITQGRSDQN